MLRVNSVLRVFSPEWDVVSDDEPSSENAVDRFFSDRDLVVELDLPRDGATNAETNFELIFHL